ncbi:hypothetical protein WK11_03115 [Burkholderia ubonensis]|nr:hypothetical protein WK11_03115 [Burkholderia ubonensis]
MEFAKFALECLSLGDDQGVTEAKVYRRPTGGFTRVGISERRLRYLIAGSREVDGKIVDVKLSYPEQSFPPL